MAREITIKRHNIIPSPNPPIKNLHNFTNRFSVFVPQSLDPPNIQHISLRGRVFREFPVNTNYVGSVLGRARKSGPKFMAIEWKSTHPQPFFKVGNASYRAKIWDPPVIIQVSMLGRALIQTLVNKIKGCPVKGRTRKVGPKVIVLVPAGRYGMSKNSRYDFHDGAVRMLAQSNGPRGGKCIELFKRRGHAASSDQPSFLKQSNGRGLTFDDRSIISGVFHGHHHENCGSTVVGPMVQVKQFITKNTDNHPLPYCHIIYFDNQLPLHVSTCPQTVNEKQRFFSCGAAGPSPISTPKITSLRPSNFGQRRDRKVNTVGPFKTDFKVGFGPMVGYFVPMEAVFNMSANYFKPTLTVFNMGSGGQSKSGRGYKGKELARVVSNPTCPNDQRLVTKDINGKNYGKDIKENNEDWTSPHGQRVPSALK